MQFFRLHLRSQSRVVAVVVLAAVTTAISLQVTFGSGGGLKPTEVTDLSTARAYIIQEVDAFINERSSDVSGSFEYMVVPGKTVAEFQAARGIVDPWVQNPPTVAIVISWTSTAVTFHPPRPRPGYEVTLAGDTLLLILTPEREVKTATVVSRSELAPFEAVAQDRVSEPLVLRAATQ
jgi:hypothetical protein